ncbi:MAG: hypothetical protein WAQ52_00855 [Terriglobales bacterium]
MNRADPTTAESNFLNFSDRELSLEEVAQIQALDATVQPEILTTPVAETSAIPSTTETIAITPKPAASPTIPIPPLRRRSVSGRYRSGGAGFQLELRVDLDGKRPMVKLSGDFFQVSGGTTSYFGSFVVEAPKLTPSRNYVVITGLGKFTWNAGAPIIRVTIPLSYVFAPPAPATVQFFTLANQPGALYICQFVSAYFRTVRYELDKVTDVATPVFDHYNTGSLPSGGPARTLSVISAYAEAGIEVQATGGSDVIPNNEAGADALWNNSELHYSMEKHFTLWRDIPQWAVWEVACREHVLGPNLYGIMFDQQGKQRQGCAIFHAGIGGITPDKLRLQLYTYVHELGHCFNLLHSWQKHFATPPQADRPGALSWMNYPWLFPAGPAAFWSNFAFQFDDPEIVHLRHAFRDNIIMGGNNFAIGASLENSRPFDENLEDNSGLIFELSIEKPNKSFVFGEPIVVKLTLCGKQGRAVHPYLHPNFGLVQLGICKPNGDVMLYRPLMDHCVNAQAVTLGPENPSLEETVYCGFGKDGFYFDRTGFYQIRAIYNAPDGSRVLSNILHTRVRHPVNIMDEEVADLFFGAEQGALFYLQGSDSEFLQHGNDCLNTVIEKYPTHPLATYARMVKGINLSRIFKSIDTKERKLTVRKPRSEESVKLLSSVVDEKAGLILDSLTLDHTLQHLAAAQERMGDKAAAQVTQQRSKASGRKAPATRAA